MNEDKDRSLTFETPFIQDESLTSWLIRAALNQGCSPLAFVYYYWKEPKLWSHDIDKGLDHRFPHIRDDIVALANTTKDKLRYQTLTLKQLETTKHINWSTPLSKRNRFGKYGYPYCPDCMANSQNAYLKLQWRYSWSIYCIEHRKLLQNSCGYCGHPYQPQLLEADTRYLNHCNLCLSMLDKPIAKSICSFDNEVYQSQLLINDIMNKGHGVVFSKKVEVKEWFDYLHFCILIVRAASENPLHMFGKLLRSMQVLKPDEQLPVLKTKLRFDYLAIHERSVLLKFALRLLSVSKSHWEASCQKLSISKNSFHWSTTTVIPEVFQTIYMQLPSNKKPHVTPSTHNTNNPRTLKSVLTMWHRLKHQAELEKSYNSHRSQGD